MTEAASGDAALTLIDAGEHFDVALLDMKMPGMTGWELAAALSVSPETSHIPLMLLSSTEDPRPGHTLRDLFCAVLTKPVRSSRLRQYLCDALLPEVREAVSDPDPGTKAEIQPALRVLLAEDNAINQRLGRLMVEKLGHHVDVVANGREATEAVHLAPYDVVLMDVDMPEMDGLDATRIIRRMLPASQQPTIVAMTASTLDEDRRSCADSGMDSFLSKPVRLGELDAALGEVVAHVEPEVLLGIGGRSGTVVVH